jgi:hypothetical protein
MTSTKLQSLGKSVFFIGFLGSCLTSFLIYVGSKEAAPSELVPYYIAHLILFLVLCVGCWMVLKGKKQKLGIMMWILLIVPLVNLMVLKKAFDLPDLSNSQTN